MVNLWLKRLGCGSFRNDGRPSRPVSGLPAVCNIALSPGARAAAKVRRSIVPIPLKVSRAEGRRSCERRAQSNHILPSPDITLAGAFLKFSQSKYRVACQSQNTEEQGFPRTFCSEISSLLVASNDNDVMEKTCLISSS